MNRIKFKTISMFLGLLTPIYYFFLLEALGGLWKNYNPISQHMSEIGGVNSPFKNIMNVFGFMGVGILIIIFGIGFYQRFSNNIFLRLASLCILIGGLFMIIVGFFPCDAYCIDITTTGKLHSLTSVPQSISLPLAAIFAGFGFGKEKTWGKRWQIISFILGYGSMTTGIIMSIPETAPIIGLIQRIGMGLCLIWIMLISGKIIKKEPF